MRQQTAWEQQRGTVFKRTCDIEEFLHEAVEFTQRGFCLTFFKTSTLEVGFVTTVPSFVLGSRDIFPTIHVATCTGVWGHRSRIGTRTMYDVLEEGVSRNREILMELLDIDVNREEEADRQSVVRTLFTDDALHLRIMIDRRIERWGYGEVLDGVRRIANRWSIGENEESMIQALATQITNAIVHNVFEISYSDITRWVADARHGRVDEFIPQDVHSNRILAVRDNLLRNGGPDGTVRDQSNDSSTERVHAHNTLTGPEQPESDVR